MSRKIVTTAVLTLASLLAGWWVSGPPAATAATALDCRCNNTTLMAPISIFLPCIDLSTVESGVLSSDGICDILCEIPNNCTFTIYARASAPSSCGSGCDAEFRVPGYVSTWSSEINQLIEGPCGSEENVFVMSRCNASCTGACTTGKSMVYAQFTLTCDVCEYAP